MKTKESEKIFTEISERAIIKKYSNLLAKIQLFETPGKRILKKSKKILKKVLTKRIGFGIIVKRSREAVKKLKD